MLSKYLSLLTLQIREETDTKIELPAEGSDSDVIVITGHKAQVEAARDRITTIQNELVRIYLLYSRSVDSRLNTQFPRSDKNLKSPNHMFILSM